MPREEDSEVQNFVHSTLGPCIPRTGERETADVFRGWVYVKDVDIIYFIITLARAMMISNMLDKLSNYSLDHTLL